RVEAGAPGLQQADQPVRNEKHDAQQHQAEDDAEIVGHRHGEVVRDQHIYYQLLALCVAIILVWIVRDRSRMGFALKALGADETVARQVGINTVALKVGTFVVSSVVMTLAGAILAPRWSYMDATIAFNPHTSFLTVIMALLG